MIKLFIILLVMSISGCDLEEASGGQDVTEPSDSVVQATPGVYGVSTNNGTINLKESIVGNANATLIDVVADIRDTHCLASIQDDFMFEYTMGDTQHNVNSCRFFYTIEAPTGQQTEQVTAVLTQAMDPLLPPIIDSMLIGTATNIKIDSDYAIDRIVSVSGVDQSKVEITEDSSGIDLTADVPFASSITIEYLATDRVDEDMAKFGLISISVYESALPGLIAGNGEVEDVEINTTVKVDISSFVESASADYTILDVHSLTAQVSLSEPNDPSNKSFDFVTSTPIYHYVHYTVSDTKGNVSSNTVRLDVIVPPQTKRWGSLSIDGKTYFGPLTFNEAHQLHGRDTWNYHIDGSAGGVYVATGDYARATNSCHSAYGNETSLLNVQEVTDLFLENVGENHRWPIEKLYVVRDDRSDDLRYVVFDMKTGEYQDSSDSDIYTACVER
ncbi:hypothetical protein MSG34_06910 [Vibrio sp. 1CM2L]|uniref:hypothetical protein n=1 Tax=Vibrio sp. 1CM2L TaxID=2929166 RepID=UPI0020BD90A0|nr:hypothetical protein [Vibrio sp. 1CM2L]MCK8075880.1 hypothetical protein [Vibrio sp. 1CM2L]